MGGENLFELVKRGMVGRIAQEPGHAALLYEAIVAAGPGDYLEIGTLWGGTAVFAALVKQERGIAGRVFTIDTMTGAPWWTVGDKAYHREVTTVDAVRENMVRFGVEGTVVPVRADSRTVPLPTIRPVVALVDGDHAFDGAVADLLYATSVCQRYILVHDYETQQWPGVALAVKDVLGKGVAWQEVNRAGCMLLLGRK
jgi:cephalosporin hydroxylase